MNLKFNPKLFGRILILFGLVQGMGIYIASKLLSGQNQIQPQTITGFSFYDLIILIIFAALFIFLGTRFKIISSVLFKIFLSILIFSGCQIIFGIWLEPFSAMLAAVLVLVLFWLLSDVLTHDIVMILTFAGIGAILGISFAPITVVWILAILSFYDIIAVYKTGHMVQLARNMIQSRAIFGFVVPDLWSGAKERISKITPGEGFMILGSGDVVLPLVLAASLARTSLPQAAAVAVFSAAGLFITHLLFANQKIRRPMAALPPVAAMAIIGYLVSQFL